MNGAAEPDAPAGALDGIRVVELASEYGAFAGKLLADLGADVIVVEPTGGHRTRGFEPFFEDVSHPERSLWWWYYNTGKQGVTLDLAHPDDACRFRKLVATADVVIEAEEPGRLSTLHLDYEDLAPDDPTLVWVSITPFGRGGPRANEPATDLTIAADAGPAWSCGYDDHTLPPVRPGGNQAYHTACLWAVVGTMTALYACQTLGIGQLVDVSMQAASNVTTEAATYEWLVARATVQRQTARHAAVHPTLPRLATASDGRQVIAAPPRYAEEFRALVEWIEELGIADQIDEVFFLRSAIERGGLVIPEVESDPEVAAMYQAGGNALRRLAEFVPAHEFFVGAQRRGLPAGIVLAPEEVIEDEHFIARGLPVEIYHDDLGRSFVYPGAPFRATGSPWRVRRRAPHVAEHSHLLDQLDPDPVRPGTGAHGSSVVIDTGQRSDDPPTWGHDGKV